MADLDPLKFAVAIQDEATRQLDAIERKFNQLQDKTIGVKIAGIEDLRNLLSALQHLQVNNLGKDLSKELGKAADGLQEKAQAAIRESLGNLAKDLTLVKEAIQHDNFTAYSKRIEKCAESVNILSAAFENFHVTVGKDEGMRNFMTGLGEVINNVRTTMRQFEGGKMPLNGGKLDESGEMNANRITALKDLTKEKIRTATATQQNRDAELHLVEAMKQSTSATKIQAKALSSLKSMATQYLGVWGGQQFLNNIIEIGGQLEMQRLSIGAILQNQSQANTLFNQITGLATQSPFGVVQLDQMTKQLTAYGFQYHELFDMTKRLADISAATGTSVDRLALALGHVRSEAALSGYTLRQFSMGNVPLLQELSEKLGKTTKEIREMVSKKEISYTDVVGVLKDLTDEGGMFYNMQEVISESVKAKFKNVKDAMDIMYGEMAEGGIGDSLKEVANILMTFTKNWKDVATIGVTVATMWGMNRAVMLLYNQTLGQNNAATLSSIAAYQRKRVEQLKQIETYRNLSEEEKEQIKNYRKLTTLERLRIVSGMRLSTVTQRKIVLLGQESVGLQAAALSSRKLTTEDILRQVALGKLTKAQAREIISLSSLTEEQKRHNIGLVNGTKRLGTYRMVLHTVGNGLKTLASSFVSLLASPQMWFIAGITAITELWQRNKREMEMAEELADRIYQHAQDAIKNTRSVMQNSDMSFAEVDEQGNTREFKESELNFGTIANVKLKISHPDKKEMQQAIEEWTDYINNYAANPAQLLNDAQFDGDNLLPLEERYKNLAAAMKEVVLAQYGLQDLGDMFSGSVKATDGGWFDNNVLTDIKDYDETYRKFGSTVASTYNKYQKAIDVGIKAAEKQDKTFAEKTKGMHTYAQKFRFLVENQKEYSDALVAFRQSGVNQRSAIEETTHDTWGKKQLKEVQKTRREMDRELESYYIHLEAELNTKGVEIGKMTKAQQQALLLDYKDQLESIQGLSSATAKELMKSFAKRFKIEADFDRDPKFIPKVDETYRLLEELIGRKWEVTIEAASDVDSLIDEARKQYKEAKEYFEDVEPILVKFGIEFEHGINLTEEQIQVALSKVAEGERDALERVLRGLNERNQGYNNATDAAAALGFTLEDNKKKDTDFIDEARKQYKEAKEYFEKANPILVKYGIKFENGKALDIKSILSTLPAPTSNEVRDELEKVLKKWNEEAKKYSDATEKSETLGFSLNEKSDTTYKDEHAKRWDERIRIMKEAYSWYDKWEKKVGHDAAIDETNSRYGDIFGEWKNDKLLPMGFDVKEIADYAKYVEKIRDDALKRYEAQKNDPSKKNGEEALRVYRQAVDLLNDVKFDNFTRAAEEFKSIIEQTINDLTDRWNIFNTVRDATGNMELASSVAGFGNIDDGARTAADAMRNELVHQLDNVGGNIILLPSVPIDEHLDESTLRAKLEAAVPDEYKSKIDGLIKTYKEWQKLQRQVLKDDVSVFANLIGAVVSYDEKVKKLNSNLAQQKASIQALVKNGTITQSDGNRAIAIAEGKTDWEKMRLSAEYANIYNNAIAMSKTEFDAATGAIEGLLNRLRKLGIISEEDYISETGKLNKAKTEWDTTGFLGMRGAVGQFISGGNDGLKNYYQERAGKARENAERETDPKKKKAYDDEAKSFEDAAQKLAKAADSAEDLCDAFSTLKSGLDLVSGLFESLGMEGAANGVGDAASVVGSTLQGAQSLSALGPWGMAAGAAIGLISGIANVRDEQLAREMEDLNETVSSIEMNTRAIERARERTLGYDNGDLRRSYAKIENTKLSNNLHKATLFDTSAITQSWAMAGYYAKNSSGSGYQQEYSNLLSQKKAQEERLKNQKDDKDATQSDIDETKEKIAELNEQILHFTEDLAKELWGIDFKGWSDQIGDALMTAFENGESAADAFDETVKGIMKSVAKEMMVLGFIEPLMNNLKKKLFGELDENGNRVGGVVSEDEMLNDPKGAATKVLGAMGEYFAPGGEGSAMIAATQAYLEGVDTMMRHYGYEDGLMSSTDTDTLSASIQGTSEETSALLAGYVNALRQDVAANRIMITQFVVELWPEYMSAFVAHTRVVTRIDANVQTIMLLMSEGGILFEEISSLRSRFDSVVNGIEKIHVV